MVVAEWKSDDGTVIRYADEGARDGPIVVLQHGFMSSGEGNWRNTGIVSRLVEAGWRVILPDARGHGLSDKPHDQKFYGEARMAADIAGIADTLGLVEYRLAGYSMGAIVALLAAAIDDRIVRLAIGGVGEGVVAVGGADTRIASQEDIARALMVDNPADAPPAAAVFRAVAEANGGDRLALAAQARAMHQAPIPLENIKMPTLVFAGDNDPFAIHPQVLVEALPDAQLEILSGDHLGVFGDSHLAPRLIDFFQAASE